MIKIFYVDIGSISEEEFDSRLKLLSPSVREKVLSYKVFEARKNCLFSRLLLREMYGDEVNIKTAPSGKPYIAWEDALKYQLPYFSISHSTKIAGCAFSDKETGFDIEYINEKRRTLPLAERFFSKEEFEFVAGSAAQSAAFYYIWTRKEAFLKAAGTGLSIDLSSFSVLNDEVSIELKTPVMETPIIEQTTMENPFNKNNKKFTGIIKSVTLRKGYAAAVCCRIIHDNQFSVPLIVREVRG